MHALKYLAEINNVSMSQIAKELGITRQTVNEWVGKRNKPIPEKQIEKLHDKYGINKSILRGDIELTEPMILKLYEDKISKEIGKKIKIIIE
ncbi:helix-turn-helix domain-containing protein [uncultured Metabacillus sp.]|uniref:helix-turn-helix domain-containing protein n=1 Tax=uncultured Metabacillus sp. TaxID=2860135 RepID=UPI002634B7DA|nr:helix-turn-helix domain-containing protein [uncultured Metabacillus sp.]